MQPCSTVTAGGHHSVCLNTDLGKDGFLAIGSYKGRKVWLLYIDMKMVKREHSA